MNEHETKAADFTICPIQNSKHKWLLKNGRAKMLVPDDLFDDLLSILSKAQAYDKFMEEIKDDIPKNIFSNL